MKQTDHKTKFRIFIHNFIKEHTWELKDSYEYLGFKNEKDMLNQIKTDDQVAMWAFTEIMYWGLKTKDYMNTFKVGEINDETPVFKIDDLYFICDFNTWTIKECEYTTKMVEVKIFKVKED